MKRIILLAVGILAANLAVADTTAASTAATNVEAGAAAGNEGNKLGVNLGGSTTDTKVFTLNLPSAPPVAPTVAISAGNMSKLESLCGPLQKVKSSNIDYAVINLLSDPTTIHLEGQTTDSLEPAEGNDPHYPGFIHLKRLDGSHVLIGSIYTEMIVPISMSASKQFSLMGAGGGGGGNLGNGGSGTFTGTQRIIVLGSCEYARFVVQKSCKALRDEGGYVKGTVITVNEDNEFPSVCSEPAPVVDDLKVTKSLVVVPTGKHRQVKKSDKPKLCDGLPIKEGYECKPVYAPKKFVDDVHKNGEPVPEVKK